MSRVRLALLREPASAPGRACGGCTACCVVMAVPELRKPGRRACDRLRPDGCGDHAGRPASCRAFHCLWLRGAVGDDEGARPDTLGVLFDHFSQQGAPRTLAFELWDGALDAPAARAAVEALAAAGPVTLSYRDGRWSEVVATTPPT